MARRRLPAAAPPPCPAGRAAAPRSRAAPTARAPPASQSSCGSTRSRTPFRPQVGKAAVAVLEAAGYEVRITGRGVCCGLTWISTGQLDGARRQLRRTLRALAPALDAGIPVVGLEPSCTAALRRDAGELLPGDRRAAALSGAVKTLAELLRSTEGWTPPDLSDISGPNAAVAQPHCHQHAVLGWAADADVAARRWRFRRRRRRLLRPGGQLRRRARSLRRLCRGRGDRPPPRGPQGRERGRGSVSGRRGDGGATILADGFSCRTQLDQLAGVQGTHLAELLASRLPADNSKKPEGSAPRP